MAVYKMFLCICFSSQWHGSIRRRTVFVEIVLMGGHHVLGLVNTCLIVHLVECKMPGAN